MNINGDLILAGNLLPAENEKYDIGSSSKKWRQVQAKYLSVGAGDISAMSPNYKFVVSGDAHITGDTLFDGKIGIGGTSSAKFYVKGSSILGEAVAGSNHTLTLNGHMIINPSYNTSNSYSEGIRINKDTNNWSVITLGGDVGSTSGTNAKTWLIGDYDGTFYLSLNGSNGAATRLQGRGNGFIAYPRLGINGENTGYNFYVNGTSYFNGNTTHNGIDYFANGTTYFIDNSAQANLNHVTIGNGTSGLNTLYKLYVKGNQCITAVTNRTMTLDTANSNKIGTTTGDLHIQPVSVGSGSAITNGNVSSITFGCNNVAYAGIYSPTSGSYGNHLIFATTGSYANGAYGRMIITASGNVGIGTMSPSYKLHVMGDIYANGGWLRTSGAAGWYSETYGGGWYMTDSNFIRNYNSKAVSINVASNNNWGIGSHRLAAVFKGNNHVSILLSTNALGYGLCVNNDGNWYWGRRTSNSETSTSGDSYLLQGNATLIRPSTNLAIGLGQVKSSEFSSAYIRGVNARHLDASGVYSGDMNLYIGYGNNSPTQKILFYYSTGTHGELTTSRTQFAEINSNGLYALTRFGVNGQNTGYNFYVNGTSYFTNYLQTTSYFKSTVATGTAPVQVTSTTLNTNLNADLLDSLHANSFLRKYNTNNEVSNTDEFKTNSYIFTHGDGKDGGWPTGTKPPGSHNGVAILHTHTQTGNYYTQLALDTAQNALWIRSANATTSFGTWERVLTNTNYTSTVDNRYVKKSGDTMTGTLSVTGDASNGNPNVAAIEVRECGRVGTAQTTNVYAPRLGFHWGGRWQCQLALQDGRLKVYDASMSGLFPFQASQVYGAVWNDYAEYRLTSKVQPGQCVIETGLGDLVQSTKRLQPGANIVSDTFGFAIGETEQTKTPLAVSGRVLAYPYEDRYSYEAGDPVCSGPNGTVSKMTREEVREYPDRIVGTVSEIPEYETWGTGNVKVDGRIWIKVK